MEPDLYRALRAKDLKRVRDCLGDWDNKNRWIWWSGTGRALSPLHVASKGSSQDILAELLRHPQISCSINESTDKASVTPLHVAAGSSSPEVVRLLLDAGADISSPSGDRSTAFHIACSRGRIETCSELLRRGSLLEARDAEQRTPLMRAASSGRADVTKWLLAEGADPTAVDTHGNSALALSCRATNLDPAQALLDGGADVVSENAEGRTCAYLAAVSGRTELLEMMLDAMVRSGQRLRDGGGSILYDVVELGLVKVVQLLSSRRGQELGVNVSRQNPLKSGTTPLHAAVFRGQQGLVTELLSRGADPNLGNESGLGSLHFACATPDSQAVVRSLLKAKADANAKDTFDCTPIYYAFVRGNDDLVHYLLARGASLFKMDYDQALRIACFYGLVQEVESLLWMEADPNSVAANVRDRGLEFHLKVSPTIRDGVRELLADAVNDAQNADSVGSGSTESLGNSGGGGRRQSRTVVAAKEAATAWGWACASPTGTVGQSEASSFTSADTSTTTASRDVWCGGEGGSDSGEECTSSTATRRDDGTDTAEAAATSAAAAPRRSGRSGSNSSSSSGKEEFDVEYDNGDFTLPVLSSLEDDLLRVGESQQPYLSPNRASAALRRWGQLVRGGGVGGGGGGGGGGDDRSPRTIPSPISIPSPRGTIRDRARATFAGVLKWATSPPRRAKVGAGC